MRARLRLRLLPLALVGAVLLVLVKAERMVTAPWTVTPDPVRAALPPTAAPPRPGPMAALAQPAPTQAPPAQAPPAQAPSAQAAPAAAAPAVPPAPEAAAERAVLEALRARRAEIDARQQAAMQREQMVAAAERRLAQRIEELVALQTRLETLERERAQREEAGLRGLVRLYEGMRPRDAAAIFDDLDMPVLLPIVDRMREARAAPVMAAMRPERARALTAEIAKLRAERVDQERGQRAAAR
jgi:flagellar motility protein MotE (MotC chaperone)